MVVVEVIAQTTGEADAAEQKRLKLAAGDLVLRVTRVRSEGDVPIRYDVSVLPLARFPGLTLDSSDLHEDIVTLAHAHGVALGRATEESGTDHVSPEVAEHLGIEPDEAVLKLERIVRCARGLPMEWRIAFRSELRKF